MPRPSFVRTLVTMIAVLLAGSALAQRSTLAAAGERCFPEAAPAITSCIDEHFRQYWERNGGLAVFGYPLAAAQLEPSPDTGATYLTQYFERQRLEFHSENQPPYDILLGRLGVDELAAAGQDWQSLPPAAPDAPGYMPQTGHAIGAAFSAYWRAHGMDLGDPGISERESLALFGYPISEPALDTNSSGDTVLTQHFERARLEDHVAAGVHQVLQGRLGSELRERERPTQPTPTPQPETPAYPAPAPEASATPTPESDRDEPPPPTRPNPEPRHPTPTPGQPGSPPAPEPSSPPAPEPPSTPAPEPPSYPAPESPSYPAPSAPTHTPPPSYPAPAPSTPPPAPTTPSYPAP